MAIEPLITHARKWGPSIAAVGVLVLAIACWSGAISLSFDGLTHFAPIWMALSLCAVVVCVFFGDRKDVAIAVAAVALQAGIIAPEFLRHEPPRAVFVEGAPTVRIVWLNTWLGARSSDGVLDYLETSGADFLLLAELHDEGQRGFRRLRELYPTRIVCTRDEDCDTSIYARRPVVSSSASDDLRIANASFGIDGAPLRLIAAHMPRPNPPGLQQAALAELAALIESDAPENVILAGDFNSTPWSFTLRDFDKSISLDRQTRALPTWPAQTWSRLRLPALFAFLPIDHAYSGGNWRLVELRRGPRTTSDHYPIEATFQYVGE